MNKPPDVRQQRGSVLVIALSTIAIIAMLAALVLQTSGHRLVAVTHASAYQEALYAAEGGMEYGRSALRLASQKPAVAWADWVPSDATTFPKTFEANLPAHAGDRPTLLRTKVVIDAPTGANTINPIANDPNLYYRIRSYGTTDVPGPRRLMLESADRILRRVSIVTDRYSGNAVTKPEVTRMIEIVVKPVTPFTALFLARDKIEVKKGKGMIFDSYDSSVDKYESGKRRWNGNIASNGNRKDIIRIEKAVIYGSIYKNGGFVEIKKEVTVNGQIFDGFYKEIEQAKSPRTDPAFSPIATTPVTLAPGSSTVTITGGASTSPTRLKFVRLHLHDKDKLVLKRGATNPSYIQIWVEGDINIHNGGKIEVEDGVELKLFGEKNIKLEETKGTVALENKNNNQNASRVQIYGVLPSDKKRKFKLQSAMVAAIYAPNHEFEVKLKSGRHFNGSMVGRSFKIEGEGQYHFDEGLDGVGPKTDFAIVSWTEDWFAPTYAKK